MPSSLLVCFLSLWGTSFLAWPPGLQPAAAWLDPSPHQVRWVTVDWSVRLEVLDWGGSGPPLVLVGCYLTAHAYDDFAPKLTNQFHVYGVTRRGIGASDKPATGYIVQRSADDVLEVLDSLDAQKSLLVGNSCAGQILTMFASNHGDRLSGLVYLDGATDPTTAEHDPPLPDPATVPRPIAPTPTADRSSFEALTQHPGLKVTFPEAEWRQQFAENPDGSVGRSLMSPEIRRAITVDARIRPNYAGVRVPALAIYQAQLSFEEWPLNLVVAQTRNAQRFASCTRPRATSTRNGNNNCWLLCAPLTSSNCRAPISTRSCPMRATYFGRYEHSRPR
jgi:pimeloyl-ACP methyl ester carboxylesterase